MVNPFPLIASTAAFLVRTPHPTSSGRLPPPPSTTTTTTFVSLDNIRSTSRKADGTCYQFRLQSKIVNQVEESPQHGTRHEADEEPNGSGEINLFEKPLLDLLPIPKETIAQESSIEEEEEEEEEQKKDSSSSLTADSNSLLFDIQEQWKAAENDFSDFWGRILDGTTEDEDINRNKGENKSSAKNSHRDGDSDNIDISSETAASSMTDTDALEDYGEKASKRHPNPQVEANGSSSNNDIPSFGVTSKILEPIEALLTNKNDSDDDDDVDENEGDESNQGIAGVLKNRAKNWMGYLSLPNGGTEQSIQDMINTARESAQQDGSDVADEKSFQEVLGILQQYSGKVKGTVDKYFSDMDLSTLRPTSLFYYLEKEDEHKNPSWKRRMHRFYPGVGVERMNELNDALTLSRVAYLDSVAEAKERLESLTDPYELIYCNLVAEPNQPAHYVAVKQHQNRFSSSLEIVLGARGTKTITDAITDLLCEDEDYRGGKAHSGVLASGRYIAEKHTPLLQELLEKSGKERIKVKLVGHSLGAGAAAIAALEFKDQPNIDVEVVGFGAPAILSRELSEGMIDYTTTVVADDDVVPRLSAATVINALLDVMEYDYVPSARRDIKQALEELQRSYPNFVTSDRADKVISDFVDPLLEKYVIPTINNRTTERMEPLLLPPGEIFHLYRNSGAGGIAGSVVPCTFFDRIDLRRNMIEDHLFHSGYERIFLDTMRLHYQDHSFQFDNPVTPSTDSEST